MCPARSTLSSCCSDLCLLLARGLEDAFPDAKKAAAAGLAALAHKLPPGALEDSAERLVQVCSCPLLSHQLNDCWPQCVPLPLVWLVMACEGAHLPLGVVCEGSSHKPSLSDVQLAGAQGNC